MLAALCMILAVLAGAPPSFALSELKPGTAGDPPSSEQQQPAEEPEGEEEEAPTGGAIGLPDPDPLINRQAPAAETEPTGEEPAEQTVEFLFDIEAAPEPVRRMRAMIVEAAASGDIERLRPLMNPGPNQTQLLFEGEETDPIEIVKSFSGDQEGIEILAILLDLLQAGFVRVDAGTPDEVYVWPYFAEKQISTLTPPEKVELLRIVTAGDLAQMQEYGNYNFFRVGITPTGEWKSFTAGD
ncbi:hypothetical protein M8R20_07705 [Pseudomonas sp. R2.Fl]|nr:hypothetical protein [Pseudomonas sp. R2.Fl]